MQVTKMTVYEGCKVDGKEAKIKNAEVLAIYRAGKLIKETNEEKLLKDDTVLLAVAPKSLEDLNKLFTINENTAA